MKYHITITNTETNEILADQDTNCIIGAYAADGGTKNSVRCCKMRVEYTVFNSTTPSKHSAHTN